MNDEARAGEVERFRTMQGADRVHILTIITPFRAALDRFVLVESADGAHLIDGSQLHLSAPLDRGEAAPVAPGVLADFVRQANQAETAWDADAVDQDVHDGLTVIVERASAAGYAIIHIVNPRSNSPHMRLLNAWRSAFPLVDRALR
jgi:hypothetical protein